MLKKELRKILLSLSFVFVAAVSCAQYVVTGGIGLTGHSGSGKTTRRVPAIPPSDLRSTWCMEWIT